MNKKTRAEEAQEKIDKLTSGRRSPELDQLAKSINRAVKFSHSPESPRVWTIYNGETGTPTLDGPDIAYAENVTVIEYSAYETLQSKIKQLEESLASMAKNDNKTDGAEPDADFLISFGRKYKGRLLSKIDKEEIRSYIKWLETSDIRPETPLSIQVGSLKKAFIKRYGPL